MSGVVETIDTLGESLSQLDTLDAVDNRFRYFVSVWMSAFPLRWVFQFAVSLSRHTDSDLYTLFYYLREDLLVLLSSFEGPVALIL